MKKNIPDVTQNLAVGLTQSPEIEIANEGGSIASIQPPFSTNQSRKLLRKSSDQFLSRIGYNLKNYSDELLSWVFPLFFLGLGLRMPVLFSRVLHQFRYFSSYETMRLIGIDSLVIWSIANIYWHTQKTKFCANSAFRFPRISTHTEFILLLIFLGICRISIAFSDGPNSSSVTKYLGIISASSAFFFLTYCALRGTNPKKILFLLIIVIVTLSFIESVSVLTRYAFQEIFGLSGLGKKLLKTPIEELAQLSFSKSWSFGSIKESPLIRSYGSCGHPNDLGGFFVLGIIVTSALFFDRQLKKKRGSWTVRFLGFAICTQALALVTTYSRSAWGTAFLGILILIIQLGVSSSGSFKNRWQKVQPLISVLLIALSICCVCFYAQIIDRLGFKNKQQVNTTQVFECIKLDQGRQTVETIASRMISEHPFSGVGFGRFVKEIDRFLEKDEVVSGRMPAHNIFYLIAAETGIPSLLVFLLFIFSLLSKMRLRSQYPFFAVFVSFMIIGFLDHYFLTNQIGALMFFTVCGGIVLQSSVPQVSKETAFAYT